ncbi:MAG: hypothetical protein IIY16_05125 [Oscillospiraceae bacterium]|nr:hypothetical protein [Oscillospiraceae bacterium]
MIAPGTIKNALRCVAGMERGDAQCATCPFRTEGDCIEAAVRAAIQYIERLEKDDMRQNRDAGMRRRVTLYTVRTADGKTLCEKATSTECAGVLGYNSLNGFLSMINRQGAAERLGYVVEREMGIIGGDIKPMQKAAPKYLYTVTDAKGNCVLQRVVIDDVAMHYGISRNGLVSVLRQRGMIQQGFADYRGDRIVRDYAKPDVKNKRRAANDAL